MWTSGIGTAITGLPGGVATGITTSGVGCVRVSAGDLAGFGGTAYIGTGITVGFILSTGGAGGILGTLAGATGTLAAGGTGGTRSSLLLKCCPLFILLLCVVSFLLCGSNEGG